MLFKPKYKLDFMYYYEKLFLPPLRRILISLVDFDEWGIINIYKKENNKEK
jgi:hypothetical protein